MVKRVRATTPAQLPFFVYHFVPIVFLPLLALAPSGCLGCNSTPDGRAAGESEADLLGQAVQALGSGPIHDWALDKASGTTALDTGTPGGVNGTLGAAATRFTPGLTGAGAVNLPGGGATSVVDLGSTVGQVGTSDFTATYWVRTSQASNAELLGNRSCGSACNFWGMRANSSVISFEFYQDAAGTNGGSPQISTNIKDGQWHFIAARRSGTTASIFVDGMSSSVTTAGIANLTSSTPLTFGSNPISGGFGTGYVGDVDEIRLYNHALLDCELLGTACAPPDQCHTGKTCNVLTGVCTVPAAKPNGTACDDGDACTQSDSCQAGTCTGANPVACAMPDACHDAGTCDAQSGACSNPAKADGTTCSKGTCESGMCTAGSSSSSSADSSSSTGSGGSGPVTTTSGCGCRVAGDTDEVPASRAFGGLALAALSLARRRRRTPQTR